MKPIYLGIFISLLVIASPIIYHNIWYYLDEKKYLALLSKDPGIGSVKSYFNYEGTRFTELNLKNGGYLSLSNFSSSSFINTDFLEVKIVGNMHIMCSYAHDRDDGNVNGINIIELMAKSNRKILIRNVGDLVNKYQVVHNYIQSDIP